MFFFFRPHGTLINPPLQQANLLRRQPLALGRHLLVGIGRSNPLNQLAFTAFADHPKGFLGFAASGCVRFQIQSKVTLLFVRPVTFVATLDEDWLDVPSEIDFGLIGSQGLMPNERAQQTEAAENLPAKDLEDRLSHVRSLSNGNLYRAVK